MATTPPSQRVYRAACPNCGAPVEFRSAAAPFAVCGFCRSTLVRAGAELRKIGESAEVFDDHTPLQIGVSGIWQGAAFTLVGRLQYRYAEGTWNEWHALFDGEAQKSAWLSEDNGRYVVAFEAPLTTPVPAPERLQPGSPLTVEGQSWTVAAVVAARLIAAQGELPKRPDLTRGFVVAELRSSRDEVGTLDYTDPARPAWSVGRPVSLAALSLRGLREAPEKTLGGRTLNCPNCGAALEVKLESTQAIVCGTCRSVVDLTAPAQQGVGQDLAFYKQESGTEPQIPLGRIGQLALGPGRPVLPWQVVGYVERREEPEDAEDEQTSWREYLLFNRMEGFAFIVDAEDGWSWTVPLTGVPQASGDDAVWQGVRYRKLYDYTGRITWVLGEFYWHLTRDQRTRNSDYQGSGSAAAKKLNRERTEGEGTSEVVWSAGETLSVEVVRKAFGLPDDQLGGPARDAAPTALLKTGRLAKVWLWVLAVLFVIALFRCDGDDTADCNGTRQTFGEASQEYQNCLNSTRSGGGFRTGGGSFGGFSTGGGHK